MLVILSDYDIRIKIENIIRSKKDLDNEKQNLDLMMNTIKNVYKEHTKLPMKKLDEILKHDLMWDAKTCLKYGLIDEII